MKVSNGRSLTNPKKVSKSIGNCIQTKWKLFPFWKYVSKSNETVSILEIVSKPNGNLCFYFVYFLGGIQNGLVTAFSGEEYVVRFSICKEKPLEVKN